MGYLNPHTHQLDTPAQPPSDRTCTVCGQPATTQDGIIGANLCNDNTCLTTAYDRAWPNKPADLDHQAGAALLATVRRSVEWLDAHNGTNEAETRLRILKVMEEAGEVAQAVIGAAGQNPRKGTTHTVDDIASELADVAITALVALQSLRHVDVAEAITQHTEKILARFDTIKAPA
jgi:NTP pyrophosphatase (non-canonical NTP hydrolase)